MAETPEICVGAAFSIGADGTWSHDGHPVARPEMVRLFARALTRDPQGRYWLVRPGERIPVAVADVPFRAVEMRLKGSGQDTLIELRTNIGDWVQLGANHPLRIGATEQGPRPYVALDDGIEALVARPVYYELAALAVPGPTGGPGVWSAGRFFSLEPASSEGGPRNSMNDPS
ncbi:MAG: hypothetical protein ACI82H_000171 [Alphaproteobacteria bacterium]|jgi:hypothetical protein